LQGSPEPRSLSQLSPQTIAAIADAVYFGVTVVLICICIGIAVGILVRSIRLGANVAKGVTSYQ